MKSIKFDFNNMFAFNVGKEHGVDEQELDALSYSIKEAHAHLSEALSNSARRIGLGLEWTRLPFQDPKTVRQVQKLGDEIASKYENVISLGIGGSYLGLKAAQDALCPPYYNDFADVRKKRPRIYFEGNNLDPDTLSVLLKNLNPKKTFVIVISKSGETTETKAAFITVKEWLRKGAGKRFGRQIYAITDPVSGSLRKEVDAEQEKDRLSFRNSSLMKGVGGRFSEFNMGLLHLAIIGVRVSDVLKGAADMHKSCARQDVAANPAYMYAALYTILYRMKGKDIAIVMPFCETLKSTADWYIQMLAESLGKKYDRTGRVVNTGRTPISARGTNDLHSIQQNNIEGMNNKAVTFIRVGKFGSEIKVPAGNGILSGRRFSELIGLAQEATEWALVRESRPNCTIILPEVSAYYWGALLYFFEMATAFEGELLGINAFDQPGVEGYKNYMYYKLGKPGLDKAVAEEIKGNPLVKDPRFIL
ncbi:MAG: glucose-6-phosphate isomerase [Candidatus Omnitrophica bacterium]|nr:glucose-6-phosphate isomerase [Candidatus Omnitrophota bacterium]MDD5736936.1 glucose-6-phosphate isomerase [Candidatus Omnitrophota bacterium]